MKRITSFAIIMVALSSPVFAKPAKPIPICVNINDLAAYKMTVKLIDMCSGVVEGQLNFNRIRNHLLSGIKDQKAFSCNLDCWLMSGTTDMASCVENNLVDSYVSAFIESTNNKDVQSVCSTIKRW